MTQRVLKSVVMMNGLFVVMILALRLLPNDDASIRTLLLPPDGCPAPCFMNIRAGITDSTEAAQLITKHTWAQSPPFYMGSYNDMYARYILWQWSGQQPSGVDTRRQGQMRLYKDQAVGMIVETTLPLGAVWLVLGATDKGTLSLADLQAANQMLLVMAYPAQGLLVRVIVPKHASQAVLWSSIAEIESSNAQTMAYFSGYHLPVLSRLWDTG
jgi:hypothetical protein